MSQDRLRGTMRQSSIDLAIDAELNKKRLHPPKPDTSWDSRENYGRFRSKHPYIARVLEAVSPWYRFVRNVVLEDEKNQTATYENSCN